MSSRSNWAKAPKTWKINRPPGLLVSIASVRLTNATPRASRSPTLSMRCLRDRPRRSSRQTTTVSRGRAWASRSSSAGRDSSLPLALSTKIRSTPAACSPIGKGSNKLQDRYLVQSVPRSSRVGLWSHRYRKSSLCNLALVCSRHHTVLHERGFRLELGPDRLLTVRTRDDVLVPSHPRRPLQVPGDLQRVPLGAPTLTGDPFDLSHVVWVMARQAA